MAPDIQRSKKTNRTVLLRQITLLQKWLSVANNTETPLQVSFFFSSWSRKLNHMKYDIIWTHNVHVSAFVEEG